MARGEGRVTPTLALIPAKRHSQGVPNKNWKPITPDGRSCTSLALGVGFATCQRVIESGDGLNQSGVWHNPERYYIQRPPDLPDTMLAVVQHALEQVPGPDDEIIVLLQPSSPLRTAETVRQAIQMLRDNPEATSVVSVSPSYPIEWSLWVSGGGYLYTPWDSGYVGLLRSLPTRRQACTPAYRRDGVVYAFRRKTLTVDGDIYGHFPLPLHTPPLRSPLHRHPRGLG